MWVLSLDTTTAGGSVAVVGDDQVVVERAGDRAVSHAERLPADVEAACAAAGIAPAAIDVWAVSSGPGSFTGLRVGLATIQGFAVALERPTVAVPTLAALAWWYLDAHREARGPVGAWLDAFRGEVFAAAYGRVADADGGDWPLDVRCAATAMTPPATIEAWGAALPAGSPVVVAGGDAFPAVLTAAGLRPVPGPPTLAGVVGRIAARVHRLGRATSPHALAPEYVRRPDAVVERERRLGLAGPP